jgi:uncharacterized protein YcfL
MKHRWHCSVSSPKIFFINPMKHFALVHHSPAKRDALVQREPNETEDVMKKTLAIALLSFAISACESSPAENSNSNKPAGDPATATPAPAATATATSPSATAEVKAGDKVKVSINGVLTDATVVSVDEKNGKATVKVQGQKEDKIVALSEIVKQ